jgi:hypothetical protein
MPKNTINPEKEKQAEEIKQRLLRQLVGHYVLLCEYINCYDNPDEQFRASVIVRSLAHAVLLTLDLAAKEFARRELATDKAIKQEDVINKAIEDFFKADTATFDADRIDILAYPKFKALAKSFLSPVTR